MKYIINYGCGRAVLHTPHDPEKRFYALANTCFGIRKSIACCIVESETDEPTPPPYYERLEFSGDVYVWREDGARKMLEPFTDEEWDVDYCEKCAFIETERSE